MGILRQRSRALAALAALAIIPLVSCNRPGGGTTTPTTSTTPVSTITIGTDDARLGHLSFDAIAAGPPAAARDGRLVLLLHGFPETGESFRAVMGRLAAAGYYAVAPNQRGFSPGARPPAVADYELADLAGDALAMATALGADRFHLVGHDWGGATAWTVAATAPGRLRSLVALSTPHPDAFSDAYNDPNGQQARMSAYMQMFRQPGAENTLLAGGANGLVTLFSALGMPSASATASAKVLGTPAALGAALNWYRANPTPAKTRTGPVSVPTRYVWGSSDIALGRTAAEGTAKYVTGPYRFQVINGGSHWLPESRPADIATAILEQVKAAP
jgi:pimeloyl-ACP methyl ester carboxylesterase